MELLILGGTFNPIHLGHLHLAEAAARHLPGARIVFVPAGIPYMKSSREIASPEDRLAMLELALAGRDWAIDRCELDREGKSYTIDTVRELTRRYNLCTPPGVLIGDDLVMQLPDWYCYDSLLREAILIVGTRMEATTSAIYPHIRLPNSVVSISSSEVRMRLRDGREVRELLPPEVYDYIVENGLYA